MHPTRPLLFAYDVPGPRFDALSSSGTGSMLMDSGAYRAIRESSIPDSNVVRQLPDALGSYRCGEAVEGAVPCENPGMNFVCYPEDRDGRGGDAAKCRQEKFRTKPEW